MRACVIRPFCKYLHIQSVGTSSQITITITITPAQLKKDKKEPPKKGIFCFPRLAQEGKQQLADSEERGRTTRADAAQQLQKAEKKKKEAQELLKKIVAETAKSEEALLLMQQTKDGEHVALRNELQQKHSTAITKQTKKMEAELQALRGVLERYFASANETMTKATADKEELVTIFQNSMAGELHAIRSGATKAINRSAVAAAELKEKLQWAEKAVNSFANECSRLQVELSSMKERMEELRQQMHMQSTTKMTTEQQQATHVSNIASERDSVKRQLSETTPQLRAAEGKIDELQVTMRSLTEENTKARLRDENATQQQQQLNVQVNELKAALHAATQHITTQTSVAAGRDSELNKTLRLLEETKGQMMKTEKMQE